MADIKTLYGNPLRDSLSVHFSADGSGNPVYPEKPSNLLVNADGSVDFGSADEMVLIVDKGVIWTDGAWNESNGNIQSSWKMRTIQHIPTKADKIVVTDTTRVRGIELLAWDSSNSYVGVWDATNKVWITTELMSTEINLAEVVGLYPTYRFRLNVRFTSNVVDYTVGDVIQWAYKQIDFVDKKIGGVDEALLFDNNTINVIDGFSLIGYRGTITKDSTYVCTDFIDVSDRIGNTIQFNSTVVRNNTGFSVYDKGMNWIDGMWGNSPDLASHDLVSDICPQRIVWTLPENAYYVKACMKKSWYSDPSDFNFVFYTTGKGDKAHESYDRNFITIAHKGYGYAGIADTLQAFINAAEAGFRAVEIDCQRTSDGVYCVSHNSSDTFYRNGTAESVNIPSSTWASLKGLTVDEDGEYPLATLASVFNTLRKYKMDYFVIDLKTGNNEEIMQIARRCGVAEQVMLSYYSMTSFIADLATVQKYPNIAVRFTPNGTQAQWEQIRNAIPNMLFTDVNISDGGAGTYFPKSFTWGIPILCSGVQESTKDKMSPVASGAMSQTTLQYSPKDFLEMVALDYNQFPTLTPSVNSISISGTGNTTITVTSSVDDPACHVFAYSDDLTVCDVYQSSFGASASIKVTGVSAGTANLIVFTASGEQLTIPVNVT